VQLSARTGDHYLTEEADMTGSFREEARGDLLARGYSRRQMMRAAMVFGGAATAFALSPELAFAAEPRMQIRPGMIRIGSNECWTGPMAPGAKAAAAIISQCNRYSPSDQHGQLIRQISQIENISEDHISTWPGSNIALSRSVLAYCSPTKGLVIANPTYETVGRAAKLLNIPIKAVPLKADYTHDVRAMLAADPHAGVYYVCNPNNPTGTMTPMADIEWLVNNKPAGSMVVIDEAYIHWTRDYPNNTATHLAKAGKDVLVMRTFSKIFGMAGMRIGFFMGRPDIVEKMKLFDNGALGYQLPIPSAASAIASLTAHHIMNQRRQELIANRTRTEDFLRKRGLKVIGPSHTNFLMVDWKNKTAAEMTKAFYAQGVMIAGPRWLSWPTVGRVSIGSKSDMDGFFAAFNKVVSAA
jgi:histidinol-phosphate aminotransferase